VEDLVTMLTCKSLVALEYWSERLIEPFEFYLVVNCTSKSWCKSHTSEATLSNCGDILLGLQYRPDVERSDQ
jgi:hypothetical protein